MGGRGEAVQPLWARRYVPPERILVLPMGEYEERKARLAADFIRELS